MSARPFTKTVIEGIEVRFPFEPYPEQIQYMSTILKTLKGDGLSQSRHTHAVLESPTGSGKTLALLCSVCAWFLWRKDWSNGEAEEPGCIDDLSQPSPSENHETDAQLSKNVRILYTTRTHAQVAQVVREFRRSGYSDALTSCILGSREHMCVEHKVLQHKESPAMVRAACHQLCSRKQCKYREGVDARAGRDARDKGVKPSCSDIEDLQIIGKAEEFCPYFYTREYLLPTAEIIFCPYNYALDPNITARLDAGIKQPHKHSQGETPASALSSFLKNSVLIIDEAHNLPSTCLSVSSIDVSTKDIEMAFNEANKTLGWAHQRIREKGAESNRAPSTDDESKADAKDKKDTLEKDAKELEVLCKLLCNFEKHMQNFPVALHAATHTVSHNSKGEAVYDFLARLNIHPKTSHLLIDMLQKTIDTIVERSDIALSSFLSSFSGLQRVLSFIQFIFPVKDSENKAIDAKSKPDPKKCAHREQELRSAYAFVVQKSVFQVDPTKKMSTEQTEHRRKDAYTMSLWCLDASLTMRRLHVATRNIIVTSGTLSPISSFIAELSIPFKGIFPSIAHSPRTPKSNAYPLSKIRPGEQQVSVSICTRGCCDTEMNSSYSRRDTVEYKLSVGNSLVNFFRVIPHGVLIFFPSYSFMRNMLTAWGYGQAGQISGVWESMKKYKKLFIEDPGQGPRGSAKTDVSALFERFRCAIQDREDRDYSPLGAVLFAVCRGRMSEGIDFPDELARGVVLIGIPYMNICDLNVHLRMKYLDDHVNEKSKKKSGGEAHPSCYLTGDVWYQQESMRAVNQAMGRAIRHKKDYGAIILLDTRFQSKVSDLSAWVQPHTEVFKSFSECTSKTAEFFRSKRASSHRKPAAVLASESSQRARTASKRPIPSVESISNAMKYEKEESIKTSQEPPSTVHHSSDHVTQDESKAKPLSVHRTGFITPSTSVNRSSSYPRTFFGKKTEE